MKLPGISLFAKTQNVLPSEAQLPDAAKALRNPLSALRKAVTQKTQSQPANSKVFAEASQSGPARNIYSRLMKRQEPVKTADMPRAGRPAISSAFRDYYKAQAAALAEKQRIESARAETNNPAGRTEPEVRNAKPQATAPATAPAATSKVQTSGVTNQQRIDGARAEYRSTTARLDTEIRNAKLKATTSAKLDNMAAKQRIDEIQRGLQAELKTLDRNTPEIMERLSIRHKTDLIKLKQEMKDVVRQMLPLQSAYTASKIASRTNAKVPPETMQKSAQYKLLLVKYGDIRAQYSKTKNKIDLTPLAPTAVRREKIEKAEAEIAKLNENINSRNEKMNLELKEIDQIHSSEIAAAKERISSTFGVQFR
jgi:hypothetical protein